MTDMKKEMLLSACTFTTLFALAIGATEASTFEGQVLLTGMGVALLFYHVHQHTRGFSIDVALAQKSLVIGVVAALPVATYLAS